MRLFQTRLFIFLLAIFTLGASSNAMADNGAEMCSKLMTMEFGDIPEAPTHIISATVMDATDDLPKHCAVTGNISPHVGFQVNLPIEAWGGRFLMQGCGGFCGTVNTRSCNDALKRKYAVAHTDMGHKGNYYDGKWAYNNRAAEIDFGYRATHVTTVAAKAIIAAFYGEPPEYSYYRGCSTGGRQGLVEAQQYPDDFDGIFVGAPPMSQTKGLAYGIGAVMRTENVDRKGLPILTSNKLPALHKAAIEACDMSDGIQDGVIGNPLVCDFDPAEIQCTRGDNESCLTKAQVRVVRAIYDGVRDENGERVPGSIPAPHGSEMRWAGYLGEESDAGGNLKRMLTELLRYMAFAEDPGPDYDPATFDPERDAPKLLTMERIYNAENANLLPYYRSGGKLFMYMGLQDTFPIRGYIKYREAVSRYIGDDVAFENFFKLYFVPGMNHCLGGQGVDTFDSLSIMEAWVERGETPDLIMGYHVKPEARQYHQPFPLEPDSVEFTRPVFPFPYHAVYKGDGDPNSPASYERKTFVVTE